MSKMKIVLIGLGGVSEMHLDAYKSISDITIIAGSDISEHRRKFIEDNYKVKTYCNYLDMIEACPFADLAVVLTPARVHGEVIERVAAKGINILCEKPLSISLEDANKIISVCKENQVKLFYGASYRYLPACQKAKKMIEEGLIGKPMLMHEYVVGGTGIEGFIDLGFHHYPKDGPGGGGLGLCDHGIHLIDLFRWYNKCEIETISGQVNTSGEKPKTEYLVMKFNNDSIGILINNEATFSTDMPSEGIFGKGKAYEWNDSIALENTWHKTPFSIRIHGTEGALRIFPYANKLYYFNDAGTVEINDLIDKPAPGNFELQMRDILDDLNSIKKSAPTGEDGYKALNALMAGYISMKNETVIKLDNGEMLKENIDALI